MDSPKRVLLIGADGCMMYFIKKFYKEGVLRNIGRLIEEGSFMRAIPQPSSTNTPNNWTTIATGATVGTHGATGFYCHIPGEPFQKGMRERGRTMSSRYCTAEYIWDAASRVGKRSIVLNYPAGWPPTSERVVMVQGWMFEPPRVFPRKKYVLISGERAYVAEASSKEKEACIRPARGWINVPKSNVPPLEAKIIVDEFKEPLNFHVLIYGSKERVYDEVLVCKEEKDTSKGFRLRRGKGTPWLTFDVVTKDEKKLKVAFRFFLRELSEDGTKVILLRSGIYGLSEWSEPRGIGESIFDRIRELLYEEVSVPSEIQRMGAEYMGETGARVMRHVYLQNERCYKIFKYLSENVKWDLFILHWHPFDGVNHVFLGDLYPQMPHYSEERADAAMKIFEATYELFDDLVGKLVRVVPKDTLIVLVSDHAALPSWKVVRPHIYLAQEGLLSYKWHSEKGKFEIDLKDSYVFPFIEPPFVWVNLEGREVKGIVKQGEEYEAIREHVIDTLMDLRDPDTNERVMELVLKKEDCAPLGVHGHRAGDVVYYLKPKYQFWDGNLECDFHIDSLPPWCLSGPMISPARKVFGNHDPYLPTARLGDFSVDSILLFKGPGVRKGYLGNDVVGLIDVAPTISYLLGIPMPANAEGRVIWQLLE